MVKLDKVQSFEQLTVWQDAMTLAEDVYKFTKRFPDSEQFSLTNQVRRAVVSISANIAEGFGRNGKKEKLHFYSIAYGSLLEVKNPISVRASWLFIYYGRKQYQRPYRNPPKANQFYD